ncbi:MAG: thioredoxin domain-containing protein [Candidatus Binataceae bacterium]
MVKRSGLWRSEIVVRGIMMLAIITLVLAASSAAWSASGNADAAPANGAVVATVGQHRITRHEMDAQVFNEVLKQIPSDQLYQMRKQAIDKIADQYLLDQAARQAHMSSSQYLDRELKQAGSHKVTEADAQKFYNQHKSQISQPFDKIKTPLMAALQRQQDHQARAHIFDTLRAKNPLQIALKPPRVAVATAGNPMQGPAQAPITIVEFADFQCPFCRAALNSIDAVKSQYGDKVRWIYMDFPLGMHAHAMDAAKAARCASAQNKFWQYHDALFADQSKLAPADLKATAKKLGLNTKNFDQCFDHGTYEAGIRKDMAEGTRLGVTGTPTFFINGRELVGAQPPSAFDDIIKDELAQAGKSGSKLQKQASAR